MSIDPKTIEFQIGKFGKLHIKNCHLFFNVSHSNNSFLLGFNHFGRIGIDIEKLSGREELPSLINYAFSEEEADYCNKGILPERFTEIWTLKEAFLKAVGVGLVDELPAIRVKGSNDNYINRLILNQKSFLCPNGETGSIVYKKKQSIKSIWLT
jgi:4'-phosphopantetheinyl transferase